MKTKIDADKILDELIKTSSKCIEIFGKKEEVSEMSVNEVKNELEKASEKLNMNDSKTYVIEDKSEHEIPNELVLKSIGSMMYDNLIDLD